MGVLQQEIANTFTIQRDRVVGETIITMKRI